MRHGLRSDGRWRSRVDVQVNDLLVGHNTRLASLRERPTAGMSADVSCYDIDMSAGDDGIAKERTWGGRSGKKDYTTLS